MSTARRLKGRRQKMGSCPEVSELRPVPVGRANTDSSSSSPTDASTNKPKSNRFRKLVESAKIGDRRQSPSVKDRRPSMPVNLSEQYPHVVSNWARFVGYPMQYLLLVSTSLS